MLGIPYKILLGITTLAVGVVFYQAVEISSLSDQLAAASSRVSKTETKGPHLKKEEDDLSRGKNQSEERQELESQSSLSFEDQRKTAAAPEFKPSHHKEQPLRLKREASSGSEESPSSNAKSEQSAFVGSILKLAQRASKLDQYILQSRYKDAADWDLLTESDWLKVVTEFPDLDQQQQLELAVQELQKLAQANFLRAVSQGLGGVDVAGKLTQITDINQFLAEPISDDILSRYELLPASALGDWKKMFPGESIPPEVTIREAQSVNGTQGSSPYFYMGIYLTGGRVSRIISQVSGALPTKSSN